ncbi:MAG: peptide chain release factor-like protein [Nitrospira sp.]|nr:MAG: peptide chain release factor-like protein [Nitrospira sp.]
MTAPIRTQPPPYHTDRSVLEQEVEVETYKASGPGGQHRNVTESAVRLVHLPSGVRVVSADSRSQHQNRERAFERLIEKLTRLNQVPRRRVPTRVPRGVRERRIQDKQRRRSTKSLRGRVRDDG